MSEKSRSLDVEAGIVGNHATKERDVRSVVTLGILGGGGGGLPGDDGGGYGVNLGRGEEDRGGSVTRLAVFFALERCENLCDGFGCFGSIERS